jgi:hypothetical protein
MLIVPFASAGRGETAGGEAAEEYEGLPVPTAAVVVDGSELFRVRGVSAFPAEKRAGLIVERIVSLAKNPAFKVEDLRIVESEVLSEIRGGALPPKLDTDPAKGCLPLDRRMISVKAGDGHPRKKAPEGWTRRVG